MWVEKNLGQKKLGQKKCGSKKFGSNFFLHETSSKVAYQKSAFKVIWKWSKYVRTLGFWFWFWSKPIIQPTKPWS